MGYVIKKKYMEKCIKYSLFVYTITLSKGKSLVSKIILIFKKGSVNS